MRSSGASVLRRPSAWARRAAGACLAFAALTALPPSPLVAQSTVVDAENPFVGDVPYVPTPQDVVEAMLGIAQVGPADYLIDLGSGDGRIVVTAAAKFGARGFGVDLDPRRVAEATANAEAAGVADRAQFFQRDLFETDFSRATVLTMYLLPEVNLQLRPRVLDLKPGTRVVSHDFDMGEWRPDGTIRMVSAVAGYESFVYFWVVPAKAAGAWRWTADGETHALQVEQTFQHVALTLGDAGGWQAGDASLRGDRLAFTARRADGAMRVYAGRIDGAAIAGTVNDGNGEKPWKAQRAR